MPLARCTVTSEGSAPFWRAAAIAGRAGNGLPQGFPSVPVPVASLPAGDTKKSRADEAAGRRRRARSIMEFFCFPPLAPPPGVGARPCSVQGECAPFQAACFHLHPLSSRSGRYPHSSARWPCSARAWRSHHFRVGARHLFFAVCGRRNGGGAAAADGGSFCGGRGVYPRLRGGGGRGGGWRRRRRRRRRRLQTRTPSTACA